MKLQCSNPECQVQEPAPKTRRFVRKGHFFRRSDGQWIPRFRCLSCQKSFSSASQVACYRQKRRKLNPRIFALYCSGVSQRRMARLLGTNRKTIVRKIRFLAQEERARHQAWLRHWEREPLRFVQFDDLETSEHSKCKPLSVALAVEPKSRKILSFAVSQMPAKGKLSRIARKKYGLRRDERPAGWNALFSSLKGVVHPQACWRSDQNPHYPSYLKAHHPASAHETVEGKRGCIVGQGELKKIGFDPLFSLNHTCAMLRANMNRLFRRTWSTTKTRAGLIDHLTLYVAYHNRLLTPSGTG